MVSSVIPANERRGLFRVRPFLFLWAAVSVSAFGTFITEVAIALLAVNTLDASPLEVGIVRASQQLPSLFFGLVIGVWVDRLRKKPLLLWSDFLRAGILLALPVAAFWDVLNIPLLCIVVFSVGALTFLYDVAEAAYLPHVIPRDRLVEGNSRIEASYAVAQTGGPALGGVLVGVLTAPFAIVFDAVSYAISGLFVRKVDAPEPAPVREGEESVRAAIASGIRFLSHHAVLRPVVFAMVGTSFFGQMFLAVYVIYLKRNLDLSDVTVGLIFALGGIGSLIGSLITEPLNRRFGVGRTLAMGQIAFGITGLLVPAAVLVPDHALPLVAASEFLQYLAFLPFFLNSMTLLQSQSPDALRGRVMSTRKFLAWGVQPLASLGGGLLGILISVPWTLAATEIGLLAVAIWFAFTPVSRMRIIPSYEE